MGVMKRISGTTPSPRRGSFLQVEWFFDGQRVLDAVDRATRRVLSRFGAFVRRTARQSIRRPRRKRISELTLFEARRAAETGRRPFASSDPGKPPRNQTGKLKGSIFFSYDPNEQSVVIAPAVFSGRRGGQLRDAPAVLEFGGTAVVQRGRRINVKPRPFMGPALEKELPKLDNMWRNGVRVE